MVIHPHYSEKLEEVLTQYLNYITNQQGKILYAEDWGKMLMHYPIKKFLKAHYCLITFMISAEAIVKLQNILRYDTLLLRYMLTKTKFNKIEKSDFVDEAGTQKLKKFLGILETSEETTHVDESVSKQEDIQNQTINEAQN
jgi:small subunit ribosomal protein S6